MKIAVGDLGEFVYRDYKEPFEQLEGGFPGHPKGALLADEANGKLLCAFCGKTYEGLGGHAHHAHGLTAAAYRREVGLASYTALVSDRVRAKFLKRALRDKDKWERIRINGKGNPRVNLSSRLDRVQNAASGRGHWSPEVLNKQGRCYAQALSVARQLAADGRLTIRALQAKGIGPKTAQVYWPGGMDELRGFIGATAPTNGRPPDGRHLSDTEAIAVLRAVALQIGRTPRQTDLQRYGLMTAKSYHTRFGSYSKACEMAGLVPNAFRSFGLSDEIDVLVAYSNDGNARRVGEVTGVGEGQVLRVLHRYGYPFAPRDNSPRRREWAADMARRLAGVPEQAVA